MIGCLADFGSKPVALLANPLIDSLTGDLSSKPSDNVSKIVFAQISFCLGVRRIMRR